ncbi:MAG: substrate-binding domain-containing protein [Planctomycetales bacterium]|nr:substrate-binding domain-containing protein [Planctomycetales bacterium]
MSLKKHAWWLILALAAVAGAIWYRSNVFHQPAPRDVNVALVAGGAGPYWQLIGNGARAAAEELGVEVQILAPAENENVSQQTALLKKIDPQKVDGVAISPLDASGQTPLINELARDCEVITFDSDAPDSTRLSYIGTSNIQAGERAAKLVEQALPSGGKVVVVLANLSKDNMIERRSGFDKYFEQLTRLQPAGDAESAPVFEIVAHIVDGGSEARCRELVANALQEHPDLACLVGMNAQHGAILASILKDAAKQGQVAIVAFDEEAETLSGIEDGAIYGTVVQDPYRYGYEAVRLLASLARGNEVVRPLRGSFSTIGVATFAVTKDELPEFRRQLAERLNPTAAATSDSPE